jgi:hypothetical protein
MPIKIACNFCAESAQSLLINAIAAEASAIGFQAERRPLVRWPEPFLKILKIKKNKF